MYLNLTLAIEMLSKNAFNRKFTFKPISCLTSHLFYNQLNSLEYLFTLDPNARVLNTQYEVDVSAQFQYSGYDFRLQFFTKESLPRFLKKSIFLNFFLEKRLSVSKDGVELYSDGLLAPEYKEHEQNIHNAIWFIGDDLKNKKHIKQAN